MTFRAEIPEIEAQRHESPTRRQLDAPTHAEREYWRGLACSALCGLIGKVGTDNHDDVAFDLLKVARDGLAQVFALGYEAGFYGEAIR